MYAAAPNAMLRYATLRYAMLCYAMLCYAMLCYATLCYGTVRVIISMCACRSFVWVFKSILNMCSHSQCVCSLLVLSCCLVIIRVRPVRGMLLIVAAVLLFLP